MCPPHQMSPLHWAAGEGHMDTMMCLVEKGAKINSKDNFGVSEWDCTTDCGLVWVWVNNINHQWMYSYNAQASVTISHPIPESVWRRVAVVCIVVIGKRQHVIFIRLYHSQLYSKLSNNKYMRQSWVEIEHYSIAYCETYYCFRSAVMQCFRYGRGSYALCKLMNTWHVYTAHMGPTSNGSSALQHFVHGNALEIRNGIMFDFYPGLPHTHFLASQSQHIPQPLLRCYWLFTLHHSHTSSILHVTHPQ